MRECHTTWRKGGTGSHRTTNSPLWDMSNALTDAESTPSGQIPMTGKPNVHVYVCHLHEPAKCGANAARSSDRLPEVGKPTQRAVGQSAC